MATENTSDYPVVPSTSVEQIEENFLRSCRNGDLGTVKQFLAYRDAKKVQFNISCKGQSKYIGWTPLHLATYFGHRDVVEYLLARNADINAINENGDTSLHKAAFIGRVVCKQFSFYFFFPFFVASLRNKTANDYTLQKKNNFAILRI